MHLTDVPLGVRIAGVLFAVHKCLLSTWVGRLYRNLMRVHAARQLGA